jgi:transcriptional regulator with XRE-family HTH domain
MDIAERFGDNLYRARKRAGISQEELGFRAELHRTEIGLLERGSRLARIDTLVGSRARSTSRRKRCSTGSSGAPPGSPAAASTSPRAGPARRAAAMGSQGNPIAVQVGENLATARERADLSQEELGVMASLHRTEISLIERGTRLPRIDTMIKLAGALEVPLEALIEGIEWSPGGTTLGRFGLPGSGERPGL